MIHTDIECFLGTLLYPISDLQLLFEDPLQEFLTVLPHGCVEHSHIKDIAPKRKKVYAHAIQYMQMQCQIDSYDQVHQYMERWYLGRDIWRVLQNKSKNAGLCVYDLVYYQIKRLSASMISKLDGKFTYKYWENQGDAHLLGGFSGQDKMHLFRGLTQLIPMDLLVVASVLDSSDPRQAIQAFRGDVAVTDSPLEQILQKGVAENHLHMGVSAGFPMIWEELMSPDVSFAQQVTKSGFALLGHQSAAKEKVCFYWAMARYLRNLLAIYFMGDFCKKGACQSIVNAEKSIFEENYSSLEKTSILLDSQKLKTKFYSLEKTEDVIDFFSASDKVLTALIQDTPELHFLRISEHTNSEGRFLFEVMQGLAQMPCEDGHTSTIKTLFLHYLRLKHGIFRMMVQHKAVGGLDYFQKYYNSTSAASKASEAFSLASKNSVKTRYKRLILAQLSNPHIKKIEFRTSFFDKEQTARTSIKYFLQAYQEILHEYYCESMPNGYIPRLPFPKIGLVFHFLKSFQEMPDLCAYGDEDALLQYQELKNTYAKQLEIFLKIRDPQKHPGIDHYLVGIDVASLENEVPTWVFASVYEKARDSKNEPFLLSGQVPYQSLGFTCHAGEDFRHLLSGLRRIYESVHHLKFHAGDRIGHGIALGVNVDEWCHKHPNVVLPRIEALENYLWAYKMLSTYPSSSSSGDLLYLEQRIHALSSKIFQRTTDNGQAPVYIPVSVLLESYERLFQDFSKPDSCRLCALGKETECSLKSLETMTGSEILKTYHCNHFVPSMKQVIHYHLQTQEIAILKTLQAMMQEFISRRGIMVEVNPSSNVIIGPIDTMNQHPLYTMSSYQCDYKDLMVCVNSDDPGVFQTNISNELGIAYMGMIERGIGREACLSWVDRLRESGMRGSFIRNKDSDPQILQTLSNLIESL